MSQYISVTRHGNNILDVYYDKFGKKRKRKVKYKPTIYFESNKPNNNTKTLFGKSTHKKVFDTLKEYNSYKWKKGTEFHGDIDPIYQYITETYTEDDVQMKLKTWAIDIEVFAPEFPHPHPHKYAINAVAINCFKTGNYYQLSLKDYDKKKNKVDIDPDKIKFKKCKNEEDLLQTLVNIISKGSPDILVGWNSDNFDFPYIINRCVEVLGKKKASKLSPFGRISTKMLKRIIKDEKTGKTREEEYFRNMIDGVILLDYMEMYKKYTFEPRESNKLDFIAFEELGSGKVDYSEFDGLHEMWEKDPQKYTDYNLVDVQLIWELDQKLGLIDLNSTITYKAKCNHIDTMGTVKIWESFLYNELLKINVCLPVRKKHKKKKYPGAYVKEPIPGIYDWTVSFDFASLYPLIMMQYNISPETFIEHLELKVDQKKVDACFFDENFVNPHPEHILTASGNYFRKDKVGIVPQIIGQLFPERKGYQAEKSELEDLKESENTKEYDAQISKLHNQQMAIKILMNSLYGAMGNKWFIFYDIRFARAITLSAQLATRSVEKHVLNSRLRSKFQLESRYIDTDSIYLDIDKLVRRCVDAGKLENDDHKIADFIDNFAAKQISPIINEACVNVSNRMSSFNYMDMQREKICINGLWTAKKKYAVTVIDNEGTRYKEPKLKVTGIETVRSSTPAVVKPFLRQILSRILTKENVYKYIDECAKEYEGFTEEQIAFPRSANNIEKWMDKRRMFKKRVPIGVRAAILYNDFIDRKGLESTFPKIQSGEKIKFLYMKLPNIIHQQDVTGFIRRMPDDLRPYVDRQKQWEKSFMNVVSSICDTVGAKYQKPRLNINDLF